MELPHSGTLAGVKGLSCYVSSCGNIITLEDMNTTEQHNTYKTEGKMVEWSESGCCIEVTPLLLEILKHSHSLHGTYDRESGNVVLFEMLH